METENRKFYSRIAGLLFIVAMVSYMIGSEIVTGALDISNSFGNMELNSLRIGIILEFVNSIAVIGIAAILYSLLRKHGDIELTGYLSSRIIEAVLLIVSSAIALVLTEVSGEVAQQFGQTLFTMRNIIFQMAMISLGIGSVFFCKVLYAKKLVPSLLAILGIVGYLALFVSGWLSIFGYGDVSMILFIPGSIFEIAFPLWLIFKGI